MSKLKHRVLEAQGFSLYAIAWKETSLIVHVFSKEHGIIPLVAKSAKRPYSVLRPILMHFQPLLLSWTGRNEIKVLTKVELNGMLPLKGSNLMSAWYMNELLLKFFAKEDPHPKMFDVYHETLQALVDGQHPQIALRRFEWYLLQEAGYGSDQEEPDFEDLQIAIFLKKELRQRIEEQLEFKKISTREVLVSLKTI